MTCLIKRYDLIKYLRFIILNVIGSSFLITCTSNVGVQEMESKENLRREVPVEKECTKERYFFKSVYNNPEEVGYIPLSLISKAISEHQGIVKASKKDQNRCYYNLLTLNLLKTGGGGVAINWGRKILESYPRAVLARYLISLGYYLQNRLPMAEYLLVDLISKRQNAHLSMIYNLYGLIRYRQGKKIEAAKYFSKAISFSLDYEVAPRLNLAFLALSHFDGGTARQALQSVPKKFEIYEVQLALAISYFLAGQIKYAKGAFERAADLKDSASTPLFYLGKLALFHYNNPKDAEDYFNNFLEKRDRVFYQKRQQVRGWLAQARGGK